MLRECIVEEFGDRLAGESVGKGKYLSCECVMRCVCCECNRGCVHACNTPRPFSLQFGFKFRGRLICRRCLSVLFVGAVCVCVQDEACCDANECGDAKSNALVIFIGDGVSTKMTFAFIIKSHLYRSCALHSEQLNSMNGGYRIQIMCSYTAVGLHALCPPWFAWFRRWSLSCMVVHSQR